jgi:WD40 repeat protein
LAAVGAIALLATSLGACSTSNAEIDSGQPATFDVSTLDLAAPANHFRQVTRFGHGRAITVATSDRADIVATTIGVDVVRPDVTEALPTALRPPLADALVTADASTALLIDVDGAGELWSIDDQRLLSSIDGVVSARFADDATHVDVVTVDSFRRLSSADGSTLAATARTVAEPTAAGERSPEMVAWFGPQTQPLVISDTTDGRRGDTWADGTRAQVPDLDVRGRIGRVVGDPTGDRAVLGVEGAGRFAGELVAIDTSTGAQRWSLQVGDDAVEPLWDVGHDGRTFVVADTEAQLVGVDGTVTSAWTVEGLESVASVISLGSSPGYAIVRARGSIQFVDADGNAGATVATAGKRLVDVSPAVGRSGVVAVDADGRIREWTTSGVLSAEHDDYVAGGLNQVAVSPDGTSGAAASTDGSVTTLDLRSAPSVGSLPQQFIHDEGNVDSVAFAPTGDAIVSGVSEANGTNSFDDTLSRWDIGSDERRYAVGGIPEPIMGCTEFRNTVLFSPDGEFFVAPFHDFSVTVRDTDDGSIIHEFPEHLSIVWGLAMSADGQVLATSSDDWTTRLWDLDDFSLISEIEAPPGGYLDVAFTPDGASLVVSDISGSIQLLDVADGSTSSAFDGASAPGSRMSVSPNGRYVAAGAHDHGTVNVWDLTTGEIIQQLQGHGDTVTSVVFTPDGLGVISGSDDGTVRVWRVESAR